MLTGPARHQTREPNLSIMFQFGTSLARHLRQDAAQIPSRPARVAWRSASE